MTDARNDQHSNSQRDDSHLLCLGLGYSAERLARRLATRGFRITGTARTDEGAAGIRARGWEGLVLDGQRRSPELEAAIASATHVLISAGPGPEGDPILAAIGPELQHAPRLAWIGYLSTIGVYGHHAGGWVDETTPPAGAGNRARPRLDAENQWLAFGAARQTRVEVFRLPGIYGPGRSQIDQMRAGTAKRIVKPGHVFNRIHVDDIGAALEAAILRPAQHAIYNLTDDEPAAADEVVAFAAGLLGMPPPPAVLFSDARLSPMAASFYEETRRVSNRRMKEALGVQLLYPTYREGLAAIAAGLKGTKSAST